MKTSKKTFLVFSAPVMYLVSFVAALLMLTPKVQAATMGDAEDEMGYEEIVKDLAKEQRKAAAAAESTSRAQAHKSTSEKTLDDVLIHGGVGVTQMFGTIAYGNNRTHLSQQGIQASLGIDLFSDYWLAEGSARNFTSADYDRASVSLKEFDLKLVYHNRIAPKLGFRAGAGVAARYLHLASAELTNDYTTPASVFTGGVELLAARNLTIGAEVGTRSALVAETIDKNTIDMTLRVDASF